MDKHQEIDGKRLYRRASEANQEGLEAEMRVVETDLDTQYTSHQTFLQTLASVSPSESQLLKAKLDRLRQRNTLHTSELQRLKSHLKELKLAQREVIPVSQRLRPSTTQSFSLKHSLRAVVTDIDFIPALLRRKAELEQLAVTVERNCDLCETESQRILLMLEKEKAGTVRDMQLILRERMQQAKELHKRLISKYRSVLQTKFVARNHKILAENEVVQQKIANEELKRRFRESMHHQNEVKQTTLQHISESVEKISLKSLRLKAKYRSNAALLESAQRGLEEFTSARRSWRSCEEQLNGYKACFATIAK